MAKELFHIVFYVSSYGPATVVGLIPGEATDQTGNVYYFDNGLVGKVISVRKGCAITLEASKRWQQQLLRKVLGGAVQWQLVDSDGLVIATYHVNQNRIVGPEWAHRRLMLASGSRAFKQTVQGGSPGLIHQKRKP